METIGDKIKGHRKVKGLSLMELAKILEVSDTALSKIETGKTKSITIDLGKGIAKALEIPFYKMFDIEIDAIDSVSEELKAENELLKKEIDKSNELLLDRAKLIKGYEREIEEYKNHLITWPEYYILGLIADASKNIPKTNIDKAKTVERINQAYNLIATAFLYSTKFDAEFIDKLEKRIKIRNESTYNYYFKSFIELVRKIQGEYEKENK